MITKKTDRLVRKAKATIDEALQTNRLKAYEELGLQSIKAKLDRWVEDYGLPKT